MDDYKKESTHSGRVSVDGGRVAITGFVVQALSALLDALESDDWESITIEPASDDGSFQKVDILIVKLNGRRIAVQVKGSINSVTVPMAERWASGLKSGISANEYRLELYAPTVGGLAGSEEILGVKLRVVSGDLQILWDAASFRVGRLVSSTRGYYHPDLISTVAKNFIGQSIVYALDSRAWTKVALLESLLALVAGESARLPTIPEFDLSLRRIIVGHENGSCTEYLKYTFKNLKSDDLQIQMWIISLTDADHISIISVSDGEPGVAAHHGVRDDGTRAFEIQIEPRWAIPPNAERSIFATVRRNPGLMTFSNGVLQIHDSLLATDRPYSAEVFILFPRPGVIEDTNAHETDSHAARWSFFTGTEQRRFVATSRPSDLAEAIGPVATRIMAARQEHEG